MARLDARGLVPSTSSFLRHGGADEEQDTTYLELFMDLVFVFAVTQLSHLLLHDLTWRGAGKTAFLVLLVWWAWNYTTWVTNWFDPDNVSVRVVLIGCMLASLLMAVAIPDAFGDRALLFAGSYVVLQVGRSAWAVWAFGRGTVEGQNFTNILAWFLASGVLWIAGALADHDTRLVLWALALIVDLSAPAVFYWLPRRGATPSGQWTIKPAYFAERFQLFILIALGESIVVTGATASEGHLATVDIVALGVAFLSTAALWWMYFDFVARIAVVRLEVDDDPGRMGRDAYTYLHLPLTAGIIVAAVGDELLIAHPTHHLSAAAAAAVVAGPAIYLLGHVAFRLRIAGSLSRRRLAGAVVIALLFFLHAAVSVLILASLVLGVLIVVLALDNRPAARAAARRSLAELERRRDERAPVDSAA
jgi:low temperature requirement protein LtrA